MITLKCKQCQKQFDTKTLNKKFCSTNCSHIYSKKIIRNLSDFDINTELKNFFKIPVKLAKRIEELKTIWEQKK